jgi:hypothetical protein
VVRTTPFHGVNAGSIPARGTTVIFFIIYIIYNFD